MSEPGHHGILTLLRRHARIRRAGASCEFEFVGKSGKVNVYLTLSPKLLEGTLSRSVLNPFIKAYNKKVANYKLTVPAQMHVFAITVETAFKKL